MCNYKWGLGLKNFLGAMLSFIAKPNLQHLPAIYTLESTSYADQLQNIVLSWVQSLEAILSSNTCN